MCTKVLLEICQISEHTIKYLNKFHFWHNVRRTWTNTKRSNKISYNTKKRRKINSHKSDCCVFFVVMSLILFFAFFCARVVYVSDKNSLARDVFNFLGTFLSPITTFESSFGQKTSFIRPFFAQMHL